MNASINLLDKYKKVCSLPSDNAAALRLGVTRAAVSRWRKELGHPEADSVEKMCNALGEPLAHWLPLIEAERARSPAVRKVWLRLAQIAAAVLIAVGVAPTHAGANSAARNPGTLYIM
ncbi:helix-turn-helix transcriptional regulator [Rhodanobacter sp. KK11]|jgi:transcriptional regulator with XRE-family HTH domain|uniref:helix-turn-helix domain-containing protein n=1 Tax=Rhodanobacter sp. KK11 TaxID=3083255 RepID=UPI0029663A9C|nr:helix-turn-helix transcriptional regulator [Rhodanobacter sp. KK11]MDW2981733.1 helix-turn-helix transcriptional regulator [Rhodanobacter sp. KK11]